MCRFREQRFEIGLLGEFYGCAICTFVYHNFAFLGRFLHVAGMSPDCSRIRKRIVQAYYFDWLNTNFLWVTKIEIISKIFVRTA